MKFLSKLLIALFLSISATGFATTNALGIDDIFDDNKPELNICDKEDCNIQTGIEQTKDSINDIVTDRPFSEYIQDVVVYVLGFLTVIAVIIIIYAGFQILIGAGDEEKLKKSKMTVLYVTLGMALIWLAYPIVKLIIQVLNIGGTVN